MIEKALGMVAAVCIFAAIAVPSGSDDDSVDNSGKKDSASTQSEASSDWFAGGHTLTREGDGHFYASANIDGASVHMMVDTGASVIALTGDDAMAIGLDWDEDEVRHIGSSASGAVYGVPVQLDEVDIGGMVKQNVRAVIIPE
ncbi:MAG: TIGR02281 family clan AA aspartic protease, partial [Erythrobacter sp.]